MTGEAGRKAAFLSDKPIDQKNSAVFTAKIRDAYCIPPAWAEYL